MNKKLSVLLGLVLFCFCILLTGCSKYDLFWENNSEVIGKTKDYVISVNSDSEYFISGFTSEGYGKSELVISKIVTIDELEYEIAYVSNIFKDHKNIKKLTIEIPNDCIKLEKCTSLRVVEIDQSNIVNPNLFLSGLSNVKVYITNSTFEYDDSYGFVTKNEVIYDEAPAFNQFKNFTKYEIIYLLITIASIAIAVVGIIFMILFLKEEYLFTHYFINAIVCCVSLGIYVVGTIIVYLAGIDNYIFIQGISMLLPFGLGLGFIVADSELTYDGLFKILLILACGILIYNLFTYEPTSIRFAEILAIGCLAFGVVAIYRILDDDSYPILGSILAITLGLLTIPSVYLVDLALASWLSDMTSGITFIIILVIVVLAIIGVIQLKLGYGGTDVSPGGDPDDDSDDDEYDEDIPEPSFSGFFGTKFELPYDCRWKYGPYVKISGYNVNISGTIEVTRELYSESELSDFKERCSASIDKSFDNVMRDHYYKYPRSPRYGYSLSFEIEGEY